MTQPNQTEIIRIPLDFGPNEREKIGRDVVKLITRRTKAGLSKFGTFFKPYSPSYKKNSLVNLTDTGHMLNNLRVLRHGPGFIIIGFSSIDANDKASFNKINGRDFLGISNLELGSILDRYR